MEIRCLTVMQPWASAIVTGFKLIENRSKPTNYRGRLYIHAGLSDEWVKRFIAERATYPLRERLTSLPDPHTLRRGYILGYVDVVNCVPKEQMSGAAFAWGPFCWILRNPTIIRPIPCRGALGIWRTRI